MANPRPAKKARKQSDRCNLPGCRAWMGEVCSPCVRDRANALDAMLRKAQEKGGGKR